ncbi:MAG: tail fiber domain-containing protein, partial [Chitinophagales bacterium]|nr:tail fiber domain-containing protein [Chitinophagales bacterium]
TIGSDNVVMGYQSIYYNTTGGLNTGVGYQSIYYNRSGSNNTGIGYNALRFNVTGNNNTALGTSADITGDGLTNATAIGYNAKVDASNKVRIGNTSVSSIGGQTAWSNFSDERIKENIQQDVQGLSFIMKLKPVTYNFNIRRENEIMGIVDTTDWEGKYDIEKIRFSGFIAQDVEKAAKAVGYDFSGVDKSSSIMGLRYAEFTVPLVKAVQEPSEENEKLKAINEELEKRLERIEKLVFDQER